MAKIDTSLLSDNLAADVEFELEQSYALQAKSCERNAPFIYFVDNTGRGRIAQGCCDNWLCARCGQIRARREYGRIVHGANTLNEAGYTLYFWTLTCRGRDMSLEQAQNDYLLWTNRLLTACRTKAKRAAEFWAYAQVTERQKRQHPHSHVITTWVPGDAEKTKYNGREVLVSQWFADRNNTAGLGSQHQITEVVNSHAVAAYVAKYLFKESVSTEWPKNWRRVRYSRNWPALPLEKAVEGWPLLSLSDWNRAAAAHNVLYVDSAITLEMCYARLITNVILGTGESEK